MVDAIHELAEGRIGMIAFTSSPQVERLIAVARDAGLEAQMRDAFTRVRIAAIGPVVEETLRGQGVTTSCARTATSTSSRWCAPSQPPGARGESSLMSQRHRHQETTSIHKFQRPRSSLREFASSRA